MNILKILIKWTFLFWTIVGLVFVSIWWLNAPQDFAKNSQSQARLDQPKYSVGKMHLEIIDITRETPALGNFKGADKRTLRGTIWFPKEQQATYPLIVYSHGFAGYHKESTHITEYLASTGYIVAAVDFPLSKNTSPAGVPQLIDVVNQPGDVSAVIDYILQLNNDPDSGLYQQVEANNIGVMGLSLGGLTTALVSFHPDLMDRRIKAAIMMAPPLEGFSDKFYATNPELKSLLISGSMDRVVPEPANATEVVARQPNGWFISFDKGTHLGFADIGNPVRWMENPDNLGCLFMNMMLPLLDLPEHWDAVLANTGDVLRDVAATQPCADLPGESMNSLKQQWLTRVAAGSFFDSHLQSGDRSRSANQFFTSELASENLEVRLTAPR